jgi:hypothetical protein
MIEYLCTLYVRHDAVNPHMKVVLKIIKSEQEIPDR